MKKYELVKDGSESTKTINGKTLYRIKALRDISYTNAMFGVERIIKAGDLGGYVESELNLSHDDSCWIADNACVYDNAIVSGNAYVECDTTVSENAKIYGDAWVADSEVKGNALIYENAHIISTLVVNNAKIYGNAFISGQCSVADNADISGETTIEGDVYIYGNAIIKDSVIDTFICTCNESFTTTIKIYDNAKIYNARITFDDKYDGAGVEIYDNAEITADLIIRHTDDFYKII